MFPIGTVDEQIFIKPDIGRLMVSPCDETPSTPCDAIPDELDVAVTMDRFEQATLLRPKRVLNRWAGLRVFVSDRSPVIGHASDIEGFVWCAALGGYGIQTAPAVARLCAALACEETPDNDFSDINLADISPNRLLKLQDHSVISVSELK